MRWSLLLWLAMLTTCADVPGQTVTVLGEIACRLADESQALLAAEVDDCRRDLPALHGQVDRLLASGSEVSVELGEVRRGLAACQAGDLDGDGVVGTKDLAILRAAFGRTEKE